MNNFAEFIDYCMSFYNDVDGLYPIDKLTEEELALATLKYLDLCASSDIEWGDGDSLDRERVRNIVIESRAIKQGGWITDEPVSKVSTKSPNLPNFV